MRPNQLQIHLRHRPNQLRIHLRHRPNQPDPFAPQTQNTKSAADLFGSSNNNGIYNNSNSDPFAPSQQQQQQQQQQAETHNASALFADNNDDIKSANNNQSLQIETTDSSLATSQLPQITPALSGNGGELSPTGSFKDEGTANGVEFTNTPTKDKNKKRKTENSPLPFAGNTLLGQNKAPTLNRRSTMDFLEE